MSRDASLAVLVVVIVGAILLIAVAGLFATSSTITSVDQPQAIPEPPSDGSAGVIFELRTTEGMRLFGVRLQAPTRVVHVGVVVPPECVQQDAAGNESLSSEGTCAGLPVGGELSGGGTTATGGQLAFVRLEVSKACYDALAVGDPWPSQAEECPR